MLPRILLTFFLMLSIGLSAPLLAENERPADRHHATILMYHHVSRSTPPSTSVSPERFIEHLDLLERDGFKIWPLDQVMDHLLNGQPLPDRVAVLTFDDAYASVFEKAMPIMQARELPFTIFVNAEPIERRHPLYMSWAQLREAQEIGGLIANHTLTHPHMHRRLEGETDAEWETRIRHEIEENQRLIETHTGPAPKYLAYPYGEYDPALEALVESMGYLAFGQQSGAASRYTRWTAIPRWAANGIYSNPDTLRTKLHALPFPIVSENPVSSVLDGTDRRPGLVLTLEPGDYSLRTLTCYGPGSRVLPISTRTLDNGQLEITVDTNHNLNTGRPRYNCTARHQSENRFFWFSRQWLMPREDGTWYEG